jgi:hypothetical protein
MSAPSLTPAADVRCDSALSAIDDACFPAGALVRGLFDRTEAALFPMCRSQRRSECGKSRSVLSNTPSLGGDRITHARRRNSGARTHGTSMICSRSAFGCFASTRIAVIGSVPGGDGYLLTSSRTSTASRARVPARRA